jgi:hypothetical protein
MEAVRQGVIDPKELIAGAAGVPLIAAAVETAPEWQALAQNGGAGEYRVLSESVAQSFEAASTAMPGAELMAAAGDVLSVHPGVLAWIGGVAAVGTVAFGIGAKSWVNLAVAGARNLGKIFARRTV